MPRKIWENYGPTKGDIVYFKLYNGTKVVGFYEGFRSINGTKEGWYYLTSDNYAMDECRVLKSSVKSAKVAVRQAEPGMEGI